MPAVEDNISFLDQFTPVERMALDAQIMEIAEKDIDPSNADQWDTLGWVFADRAHAIAARDGNDVAVVAVGLAASMFAYAEHLRSSGVFS